MIKNRSLPGGAGVSITFSDTGDSGSTAYFVVQVENDDKKGSWGEITSAIIP
ncbi:MAG: hypothetical protein LBD48_06700 [Treponema sp.]|jgi:hypothetical protein|nr:hypothetical protein [Treponema sp.]